MIYLQFCYLNFNDSNPMLLGQLPSKLTCFKCHFLVALKSCFCWFKFHLFDGFNTPFNTIQNIFVNIRYPWMLRKAQFNHHLSHLSHLSLTVLTFSPVPIRITAWTAWTMDTNSLARSGNINPPGWQPVTTWGWVKLPIGISIHSMAMQQETIDWRYLPQKKGLFFRPKFQGIFPLIHSKAIMLWVPT